MYVKRHLTISFTLLYGISASKCNTYSAAAHVYDVIPYELATDGQVTQK